MSNLIDNPIRGGIWLISGGLIAWWYSGRIRLLKEQRRVHDGSPESRKSLEVLESRVVIEGFAGAGSWVLLFVLLDWLF